MIGFAGGDSSLLQHSQSTEERTTLLGRFHITCVAPGHVCLVRYHFVLAPLLV